VDLNLFKVQREFADPISSADASIVHNLNTDVRIIPQQASSLQLLIPCTQFRDLFAMLVISSVNVDVQEAALVEVCAALNMLSKPFFLTGELDQVDQRGFKVLAYCSEHDSANEQHQWREVSAPLGPWLHALVCGSFQRDKCNMFVGPFLIQSQSGNIG
jgi:hypothetical protein